jgi:hypothetical protein
MGSRAGVMKGASEHAVYNAPIPSMPISPSPRLRAICPLLLAALLLTTAAARATDWTGAEEQLARKVAAITGPGAVAFDLVNRSSLNAAEADEIRRGLLLQLATLGLRVVNVEQSAATIQVSLSEDLQSYVWVAEIHQGTNQPVVVMTAVPRSDVPATGREPAGLVLRKTLLWSEQERILDAAVLEGSPAQMVVLDSVQAALYRMQDGHWQLEQPLPITHVRPWPRDLRGRLVLRRDHLFDAYLPGIVCRSSVTAPLALSCNASDDPWPLGGELFQLGAFYAPARNYFTGPLSPGIGKLSTAPAFYSAALLPRGRYTLGLFAAVDGQLHLLDGMTDRVAGRLGWGSDLAGVKSNCGSGWQVLATRRGEGPDDAVQAYEFPDREPVAVSQALVFAGRITALWAESAGESAVAVSQNAESGRYEAYRLTITCGQ